MVTETERAQIEARLGPISHEAALHAVRDGRGRQFQRMEFLGDSVLDVILAVHVWAEPQCPACVKREATAAASDLHLAEAARRAGLGAWLEWRASDERIADLVETCVAACWLSGRWEQAARFAAQVVHPVGDETVRALVVGAAQPETGRVARRAGSALLELAAGESLVRTLPDADEGELSRLRADSHRTSRVAAHARRTGLVQGGGEDAAASDQVEAWLAGQLLHQGAAVALAGADVVLR